LDSADTQHSAPRIIPRAEHNISRSAISESALRVLYGLKKAGFDACLVGGGVRDLLLGREPKDFDVATNASPEEVRKVFRNCRLIGRRFRLAHVRFGREIIEVATYRAGMESVDDEEEADLHIENGRILRDNVYGTLEQDAWRRDFTVNALYYNIRDFSVIDYVGGYDDLQAGLLRLIGDPQQRYHEDPVRMLRAVRFAAKLGLRMHADTESPVHELAHLLETISPARLFEEVLKLFHGGYALQTFEMLRHYGLFAALFPDTERSLAKEENGYPHILLSLALANTDQRVREEKSVNPAFLFAALLWEPMREFREQYIANGMSEMEATHVATDRVLRQQRGSTTLPKRHSLTIRDIYTMQLRFHRRQGKRCLQLLELQRFRAAYDFLLLRAEAGEEVSELAEWWTKIQTLPEEQRESMLLPGGGKPRRRRRARRHKPAGKES
jgi:poly(A) polymerase